MSNRRSPSMSNRRSPDRHVSFDANTYNRNSRSLSPKRYSLRVRRPQTPHIKNNQRDRRSRSLHRSPRMSHRRSQSLHRSPRMSHRRSQSPNRSPRMSHRRSQSPNRSPRMSHRRSQSLHRSPRMSHRRSQSPNKSDLISQIQSYADNFSKNKSSGSPTSQSSLKSMRSSSNLPLSKIRDEHMSKLSSPLKRQKSGRQEVVDHLKAWEEPKQLTDCKEGEALSIDDNECVDTKNIRSKTKNKFIFVYKGKTMIASPEVYNKLVYTLGKDNIDVIESPETLDIIHSESDEDDEDDDKPSFNRKKSLRKTFKSLISDIKKDEQEEDEEHYKKKTRIEDQREKKKYLDKLGDKSRNLEQENEKLKNELEQIRTKSRKITKNDPHEEFSYDRSSFTSVPRERLQQSSLRQTTQVSPPPLKQLSTPSTRSSRPVYSRTEISELEEEPEIYSSRRVSSFDEPGVSLFEDYSTPGIKTRDTERLKEIDRTEKLLGTGSSYTSFEEPSKKKGLSEESPIKRDLREQSKQRKQLQQIEEEERIRQGRELEELREKEKIRKRKEQIREQRELSGQKESQREQLEREQERQEQERELRKVKEEQEKRQREIERLKKQMEEQEELQRLEEQREKIEQEQREQRKREQERQKELREEELSGQELSEQKLEQLRGQGESQTERVRRKSREEETQRQIEQLQNVENIRTGGYQGKYSSGESSSSVPPSVEQGSESVYMLEDVKKIQAKIEECLSYLPSSTD